MPNRSVEDDDASIDFKILKQKSYNISLIVGIVVGDFE